MTGLPSAASPQEGLSGSHRLVFTRFGDRKPRRGDSDELCGEEHLLMWCNRVATYDHACISGNWTPGEEIDGLHPDDLWAWLPISPTVSASPQEGLREENERLRAALETACKAARELRLADSACARQDDGSDQRWDHALEGAVAVERIALAALAEAKPTTTEGGS